MSKVLVKITPNIGAEQNFIMEEEDYDSLIKKFEENKILFSTMPTEFHWMKKGVEWCINMFVVFMESFPDDYMKEFQGGRQIVLEDS